MNTLVRSFLPTGQADLKKCFVVLKKIESGRVMQSVHISEDPWQINPGWKWVSNPENLRSSASHSWVWWGDALT